MLHKMFLSAQAMKCLYLIVWCDTYIYIYIYIYHATPNCKMILKFESCFEHIYFVSFFNVAFKTYCLTCTIFLPAKQSVLLYGCKCVKLYSIYLLFSNWTDQLCILRYFSYVEMTQRLFLECKTFSFMAYL